MNINVIICYTKFIYTFPLMNNISKWFHVMLLNQAIMQFTCVLYTVRLFRYGKLLQREKKLKSHTKNVWQLQMSTMSVTQMSNDFHAHLKFKNGLLFKSNKTAKANAKEVWNFIISWLIQSREKKQTSATKFVCTQQPYVKGYTRNSMQIRTGRHLGRTNADCG